MLALWLIYTQKISRSVSAFFVFFFSSDSYLLTPAMDTAALAGTLSSLLYEKKNAKEYESLTWPSKFSEYLTVTQLEL